MLSPRPALCAQLRAYNSRRAPIRLFRITGSRGALNYEYQQDSSLQENRMTVDPASKKGHENMESLDLALGGYIYHPYLLNFNATSSLALSHDVNRTSETTHFRDRNVLYGLSMNILQRKPVNLALDFRRSRLENRGTFSDDKIFTTTGQGATFSFRNRFFPCRVYARNTHTEGEFTNATDTRNKVITASCSHTGALGTTSLVYSASNATEKSSDGSRDNTFNVLHANSFWLMERNLYMSRSQFETL